MEVLRGRTLLELWERAHSRKRRLPYEVVAWIGARVADALHHAHELRDDSGKPLHVIHRDVSPSNIFVTDDGRAQAHRLRPGQGARSHRFDGDRRHQGQARVPGAGAGARPLGRPARRHLRPGRDALGGLARPPALPRRQRRRDGAPGARRGSAEPDDRRCSDYPPALAEALARALAKDPAARFQTAAGLRDALDAFVQSSGERWTRSGCRRSPRELFDGARARRGRSSSTTRPTTRTGSESGTTTVRR